MGMEFSGLIRSYKWLDLIDIQRILEGKNLTKKQLVEILRRNDCLIFKSGGRMIGFIVYRVNDMLANSCECILLETIDNPNLDLALIALSDLDTRGFLMDRAYSICRNNANHVSKVSCKIRLYAEF